MNNKSIIIAGVGAALVLGILGVFMFRAPATPNVPPTKAGAIAGPISAFNYSCVGGVCTYDVSQAISATSSVLCAFGNPTNAFSANGLSTSTGATSTLVFASIRFDANTLGSQNIDVSTSSSAVLGTYPNVNYGFFGSSTPAFIYAASVGTGKTDLIWAGAGASTTNKNVLGTDSFGNSNGTTDIVVKPSEGVTFRISTSSPGTYASYPTGTCQAEFISE